MTSVRRAALALVPVLTLGLVACGSDADTAASSTPTSTAAATTTTTAPASTAAPGTTAIGQPIPIGQETTVAPTTTGTRDGNSTGPSTTTASGASATTAAKGSPTTTPTGGTASSTTVTTTAGGDDGSDGSSEPPSPNADTAFCQFEYEVEQTGANADSDEDYLKALAPLVPRMDQWITDAPNNELKTAATTMRDAAKQAVASGSQDPLFSDEATEALLRIRLFCGST